MKYLLAKHQPDLLWSVGVKFGPPAGKFDAVAPPSLAAGLSFQRSSSP